MTNEEKFPTRKVICNKCGMKKTIAAGQPHGTFGAHFDVYYAEHTDGICNGFFVQDRDSHD